MAFTSKYVIIHLNDELNFLFFQRKRKIMYLNLPFNSFLRHFEFFLHLIFFGTFGTRSKHSRLSLIEPPVDSVHFWSSGTHKPSALWTVPITAQIKTRCVDKTGISPFSNIRKFAYHDFFIYFFINMIHDYVRCILKESSYIFLLNEWNNKMCDRKRAHQLVWTSEINQMYRLQQCAIF